MDFSIPIGNFTIGLLDFIIIFIMLASALSCTLLGFSRSAAKSLGWILCYPVALYLTSLFAQIFNDISNIGYFLSAMLSFALISVLVFAIFNIIGSFLGNLLSGVGLEALDKVLGFVWGFLVSIIISLFIVWIVSSIGTLVPLQEKSFLYGLLLPYIPSGKAMILGVLNAVV